MAKKKVQLGNLGMIVSVVAALLAVVAFFLMFAPAATYEKVLGGTGSYSGAQLTFGYTEETDAIVTTVSTKIFNFSFLNLLPYILLVVGIVFNFLTKFCRFSNFISAGCYVLAGVLFFLVIIMCAPNFENADLVQSFKDGLSLGAGAIVAGILSILAALASLATLFIKK